MNKLELMKAKLARGGQVSGGELRLIIKDFTELIELLQERVNELEKKLNAKPRGSSKRAADANPDN